MSDVDDEVWDNWEILDSKLEAVVYKTLVVLSEYVENNLMVRELDFCLENYYSREKTRQTTDKDDKENGALRKTTTIDDKLKTPVVRLAQLFFESVFRGENRASDVGDSQLQDQNCKLDRDE